MQLLGAQVRSAEHLVDGGLRGKVARPRVVEHVDAAAAGVQRSVARRADHAPRGAGLTGLRARRIPGPVRRTGSRPSSTAATPSPRGSSCDCAIARPRAC